MGVQIRREVISDDLAGIIVWSDTHQEWIAAINPNQAGERQLAVLRDLCAGVGESCDPAALAVAS